MLINCPECKKEISSESEACIHCGYPLKKKKSNLCLVNGKEHDLSFLLDEDESGANKLIMFVQLTDCYFGECADEVDKIANTKIIPKFLNFQTNTEFIAEQSQVKCPKCGSTQVTAGQRGFKLVTGFIGSSKTVNRCGTCGYSWKPKLD